MSKFGDAFAAARKGGKSEFSFNGKSYNTRMKQNLPDMEVSGKKSGGAGEKKWADPGAKEGGKPRNDEPAKSKVDKTGWSDPGDIENKNRSAGYAFRKGGMVKKAGAATIGVTRSSRDYGKKH